MTRVIHRLNIYELAGISALVAYECLEYKVDLEHAGDNGLQNIIKNNFTPISGRIFQSHSNCIAVRHPVPVI